MEILHQQMLIGLNTFTTYINSLLDNIIFFCAKKHQNTRKTTLQMIDQMTTNIQYVHKDFELKFTGKRKLA